MTPEASDRGFVAAGPTQIGFVVPDLDAAMSTWLNDYGVGPWQIWNIDADEVVDPQMHGRPARFALRVASAAWGPLEIELIQPMADDDVFAESLRAHGGRPHVHHLKCQPGDYDRTLEAFLRRDQAPVLSGGLSLGRFAYLATQDEIGTIIEINHREGGGEALPNAVYGEDGPL